MKQVFANLSVERGLFGFVKPFEKQHFDDRLYRLKPGKSEYGDNWDTVQEAFGLAIAMLHRVWNNPTSLSRVARNVRVLIGFNNDYSTWMVEVAPYGFGPPLRETHPDFKSSVEKEENQIIEKYGFVSEKHPEKYEVFFRGRSVVMGEEQLDDFRKDIIEMYPNNWADKFSFKVVEGDDEKRKRDKQ